MKELILNELRDGECNLVARGDMEYVNRRLTEEFGSATIPSGWLIRVYKIQCDPESIQKGGTNGPCQHP